jgi:hypothetical protein
MRRTEIVRSMVRSLLSGATRIRVGTFDRAHSPARGSDARGIRT